MNSEVLIPVTFSYRGHLQYDAVCSPRLVSRRRLAARAHVLLLARPCGIYGLHSSTGIRFFPGVIGV
jgi:hypothetical protein